MRRIDFTDEQIEIGKDMRRKGKAWSEIGELFGVSGITAKKCVMGESRTVNTLPRGMRRYELNLGDINRPIVPPELVCGGR